MQAVKAINKDILTIFGGIHVTACSAEVISHPEIDAIAIGQAEVSFRTFLELCSRGTIFALPCAAIDGIVFKKDGHYIGSFDAAETPDLDQLPSPDKSIYRSYYNDPYIDVCCRQNYWIMASRGCPYKCAYCFNALISPQHKRSFLHRRSVASVIAELEDALKKNQDITAVTFLDDSFATNKDWLLAFCDEYSKRVKLPFACSAIPATVDEHVVNRLKESGCFKVNLGIQSLDPVINKNTLSRVFFENSEKIIKLFNDKDIAVWTDFILGIPADTRSNLEANLFFLNRAKPSMATPYLLEYFPGLPILKKAMEMSFLTEEEVGYINKGVAIESSSQYLDEVCDIMRMIYYTHSSTEFLRQSDIDFHLYTGLALSLFERGKLDIYKVFRKFKNYYGEGNGSQLLDYLESELLPMVLSNLSTISSNVNLQSFPAAVTGFGWSKIVTESTDGTKWRFLARRKVYIFASAHSNRDMLLRIVYHTFTGGKFEDFRLEINDTLFRSSFSRKGEVYYSDYTIPTEFINKHNGYFIISFVKRDLPDFVVGIKAIHISNK